MFPRLPLRLAAFAVLLSPCLPAQAMAGDYSVDPNGTGARNFKTIYSSVVALATRGMSGHVRLSLADGLYKEEVRLVPIKGLGASATLTFRAANRLKAEWQATNRHNPAVSTSVGEVTHVVFDGIRFTAGRYGFYPRTVTRDWAIRNCSFESPLYSAGFFYNPVRCEVHHNVMKTFSTALLLANASACSVHHNDIRLAQSNGIFVATTNPGAGVRSTRVFNNLIVGALNRSSNGNGIELGARTYDVEVVHNTVVVSGAGFSTQSCIYVGGTLSRPNRILGNIFQMTGSGSCLRAYVVSAGHYRIDRNVYFQGSPSGRFIVGGSTDYGSLAAWQKASGQDQDSRAGNPAFVNASNAPFDLHLKRTSPAVRLAAPLPFVRDDFEGAPRHGTAPDAGAMELRQFAAFGSGCAGLGGFVPKIDGGAFFLGSTAARVGVSRGRPVARAFLIVGVSNTRWGSFPLPLRFGSCRLLVSADLLLTAPLVGSGPGTGVGALKFAIPADPKLLGHKTFFQWAVPDAAAAGIGLAFSDALTVEMLK